MASTGDGDPSYYNLAYGTRGYDAPGHGEPSPGPDVYGAPVAEAPVRDRQRHEGPRTNTPAPQYGTPAPQYGTPAPQYGTPAPQRGGPGPQYGAAGPEPGARGPRYGNAGPQRGGPGPQYGAPAPQQGGAAAEPGSPAREVSRHAPPAGPAYGHPDYAEPPSGQYRQARLAEPPRAESQAPPAARTARSAAPAARTAPQGPGRRPELDADPDSHLFGLNVPRQSGPVSAPFTAPVRRAPDRDEPFVPETGTGPRSRRSVTSPDRIRPGSRRAQTGAKPARRWRGPKLEAKGWLWIGAGVVAIVGVAIVALTVLGSGPSGPKHSLTTPARIGSFTRSTQLTKQMDVGQLEKSIIAQSSGQASHLVSAVYQTGSPASGGPPAEVMLFIGGQLSGASPAASVKSFTQHFKDATLTSAGSLGGDAACVSGQSGGTSGSTVCAWFDNNTFGELVSPDMSVSALANELRAIRPSVEHVVK